MTPMYQEDGFLAVLHASDSKWHWTWIAATMETGALIEGTRGYKTRAGAISAAKATAKRLTRYCIALNGVKL